MKATFPNGVEMNIRDDTENGVTFEGTGGRIFVTRDRIDLSGGAVAPLYEKGVRRVAPDRAPQGQAARRPHGELLRVLRDRAVPVSDVWTHHRALTTCHLANIAIRLGGRKLTWNPETQQIEGDDEANAMQTRPQRAGFEVTA